MIGAGISELVATAMIKIFNVYGCRSECPWRELSELLDLYEEIQTGKGIMR